MASDFEGWAVAFLRLGRPASANLSLPWVTGYEVNAQKLSASSCSIKLVTCFCLSLPHFLHSAFCLSTQTLERP